MPFDIVGFAEAAPGANGNIAAVTDQIYKTASTDYLTVKSEKSYLLGVYVAQQSTGAGIKLQQPGLKPDYYFPKSHVHGEFQASNGWHHLFGRPLPLFADKLNVNSVNATDEDTLVALLLGDGKISQSALDGVNPTHSLTGYADVTVTANAWTTVAVTWDEDLPPGKYAVVGMRVGCWLTGTIAEEAAIARLILPDAPNHRPGVPVTYMGADHKEYQATGVEPWVDWPLMPEVAFKHDQPPNLEVLSQQAWTDEDVHLQLQRIG